MSPFPMYLNKKLTYGVFYLWLESFLYKFLNFDSILYCSISFAASRKRSYIWNFFDELSSKVSRCKLCYRKMNKNLARHLRLKHPKAYKTRSASVERNAQCKYFSLKPIVSHLKHILIHSHLCKPLQFMWNL